MDSGSCSNCVEDYPLTIRAALRPSSDLEQLHVSVHSLCSVFESTSSLQDSSDHLSDVFNPDLPDIVRCSARTSYSCIPGPQSLPMLESLPIHHQKDCIDGESSVESPDRRSKRIDNKLICTLRSMIRDKHHRSLKTNQSAGNGKRDRNGKASDNSRIARQSVQQSNDSLYEGMLHAKQRKSGKVQRKDSFKKLAVLNNMNAPPKSCLKSASKTTSDIDSSNNGSFRCKTDINSGERKRNKSLCRENWLMCTSYEADTTDGFYTSSEEESRETEKNTQINSETHYSAQHHIERKGSEISSYSVKRHRKCRPVCGSLVQRRVSFKDTPILHRRIGSSSPAIDASKRVTLPLPSNRANEGEKFLIYCLPVDKVSRD